jgi:hypothetical protein
VSAVPSRAPIVSVGDFPTDTTSLWLAKIARRSCWRWRLLPVIHGSKVSKRHNETLVVTAHFVMNF